MLPSARHQATVCAAPDRARGARGRSPGARRTARRRGWSRAPAAGAPGRTRAPGTCSSEQVEQRLEVGAPARASLERRPAGLARSCRRSGTRSATRRRRDRGTARRPRPPPRAMRASGRSTLLTTRITRQVGPRAPCAARSASGAAGPRRRRRAAARRRPSSARARPRRRSRRGPACRRCSSLTPP